MALLNFSITIPDNQVARAATTIKKYLGNPAMTDAQAIEGLRQEFIVRLKDIVSSNERANAIAAAENANYDLSAT